MPLCVIRQRDERGVEVEIERSLHTFTNVYGEMFMQVCLDIPNLGDFRVLTDTEIRFFYNGLRESLKRRTKRQ